MGRKKKNPEVALTHIRVRIPNQTKTDIQTIVTMLNTTLTDVFRNEIYDYVIRSVRYEDDPIYPTREIRQSERGAWNDDYIRFQLPLYLHGEFKRVVNNRGLDMSFLLRKMAEKYLKDNPVEHVLLDFLASCKEEASACA